MTPTVDPHPAQPQGSSSEPPGPVAVALDEQTIDRLARRVVALIGHPAAPSGPAPDGPAQVSEGEGRYLSAAQVAQRWQVDRGWVYAHAQQLGALRLGTGPKPRLRFDADVVRQRLTPPDVAPSPTGSPPMGRKRRRSRVIPVETRELLAFRVDPELSSADPEEDRAGRTTIRGLNGQGSAPLRR